MISRSKHALALGFLLLAACTSPRDDEESSASGLTCVPKQELVCLCGLREGVQTCSAKGVLGKCRCPDDATGEEKKKESTKEGEAQKTSSTAPPPTPENPKPEPSVDPQQACVDVADALFDAAVRCQLDAFAEREAFIEAAAGGSCANITALRDAKSLYDACIPWFEAASCAALTNGPVDPSCASQLLR